MQHSPSSNAATDVACSFIENVTVTFNTKAAKNFVLIRAIRFELWPSNPDEPNIRLVPRVESSHRKQTIIGPSYEYTLRVCKRTIVLSHMSLVGIESFYVIDPVF